MTEKKKPTLHLGEILIRNGVITWEQLEEALEIQKTTGRIIGEILLGKNIVSEKELYHALSIQFEMAYIDFDTVVVAPEVVNRVNKEFAYSNRIMPLIFKESVMLVAVSDPMNAWVVSELQKLFHGYEVKTVLASPQDIDGAIKKYYGPPDE